MGKVYDALRRAEAQRKRDGAGAMRPLEMPAERLTGGTDEIRGSRLREWTRRLRRTRTPAPAGEGGDSVNKRRIVYLQPDSFVAEQFRSLRARLDSLAAERPIRSIAVTSALPDEGKTTAAVNLAIVSSMSVGRRVLLVDCDLRRPKVHTALSLRPEFGLAEVLLDQSPLDRAIVKVEGAHLEALAVRGTPPNPSELLASERMRSLVAELSQSYDQVILDVPPTLALPDAKIVSELCDGLLLVVRADRTSREDVEATLDILDRRRILGLVLNGVETDAQRYGY
jgi:capsular exopolysaccharide synthesis family protein